MQYKNKHCGNRRFSHLIFCFGCTLNVHNTKRLFYHTNISEINGNMTLYTKFKYINIKFMNLLIILFVFFWGYGNILRYWGLFGLHMSKETHLNKILSKFGLIYTIISSHSCAHYCSPFLRYIYTSFSAQLSCLYSIFVLYTIF